MTKNCRELSSRRRSIISFSEVAHWKAAVQSRSNKVGLWENGMQLTESTFRRSDQSLTKVKTFLENCLTGKRSLRMYSRLMTLFVASSPLLVDGYFGAAPSYQFDCLTSHSATDKKSKMRQKLSHVLMICFSLLCFLLFATLQFFFVGMYYNFSSPVQCFR